MHSQRGLPGQFCLADLVGPKDDAAGPLVGRVATTRPGGGFPGAFCLADLRGLGDDAPAPAVGQQPSVRPSPDALPRFGGPEGVEGDLPGPLVGRLATTVSVRPGLPGAFCLADLGADEHFVAAAQRGGLAIEGPARRSTTTEGAASAEEGPRMIKISRIVFCNLFAVWLAISAVLALSYPPSFTWVKLNCMPWLLSFLMLSVGITTTIRDFKDCFRKPGVVGLNFIMCYVVSPLLAWGIAKVIRVDPEILAGLVLVGSINGGQASGLCTFIAGGDVALSVLMTTCTTFGCIFMTPVICSLIIGQAVPIAALGMVLSAIQVLLVPITLGVGLNTLAPNLCKAVSECTPVIGVIITVLLVGGSVAHCADPIRGAGAPLQLALLGLHLLSGILGFGAARAMGYDERTCRTVAIETAMKSSAFGFVLAREHFGDSGEEVSIPSAVSAVWMAIVGSVLAAFWNRRPVAY